MNLIKIKSLKKAYIKIEKRDPTQIKATLFFNNQKFSLTWYADDFMIYDCFSDDERLLEIFCNEITNTFKKEVKEMKKQELFEKAVNAIDNYTKSIEMGLSDFANYYHCRMKELCDEIKVKGLSQEFEEFALVI